MGLFSTLFVAVCISTSANAQQAGSLKEEQHPRLSFSKCTKASGCTSQQGEVTIDQNWRWVHKVGQPKNCYTGNKWDTSTCPDGKTCAQNCAVGSATTEYESTYGVQASGSDLKLGFVTQGPYSKNVGSRNYLMQDESNYQMFKLKNKEFTFDVDVSKLPCGLNGALYFVAMDQDGGMSQYPGNKAGAKYGTGYCDAQCPRDIKFINGEGNVEGWNATGADTGTGSYGSCCTEMDIWEANSISTAYTAHACTGAGQTRCTKGAQCGDGDHRFDGICDKNGCDFQTYRLGNKDFWGTGSSNTIDTSKPVTVVTQFITEDGTDTGALKEIRRHYKQNDKFIQTPSLQVGSGTFNSISTDFCKAELGLFKDKTNFLAKGGLKAMDEALTKGMVLVLSLWDDHDVGMLWLDSDYPTDADPSKPGVARGTCDQHSGDPATVERDHADASVSFSNIKYGELGSTDGSGPSPPGPSPPTPPSPGPIPSCPGGSLEACIGLCPSDPTTFKACVAVCQQRCKTDVTV